MSGIEIILPERVSDRIADDLYELTEALSKNGADISSGFLGGEFGYGAYYENDAFMMHPFCWCDGPDCAWCLSCECDDRAVRYFLASGAEVCGDAFFDAGGYRTGRSEDVPEFQCGNCKEKKEPAPNFLHKASGTRVHWYKYIGRSMEMKLLAEWDVVIRDCMASIKAAS